MYSAMPAREALRHCVEAARLALSFRPFARLAQAQEPGGPGGEAGGRGGLRQAAISDLIATHRESHNRRQLSIPPPTPFGGVGSMLGESLGTIVKDAL
jgi:hypothetical protein